MGSPGFVAVADFFWTGPPALLGAGPAGFDRAACSASPTAKAPWGESFHGPGRWLRRTRKHGDQTDFLPESGCLGGTAQAGYPSHLYWNRRIVAAWNLGARRRVAQIPRIRRLASGSKTRFAAGKLHESNIVRFSRPFGPEWHGNRSL